MGQATNKIRKEIKLNVMASRIANEVTETVTQDTVQFHEIFVDETQNMRRFPPPVKYVQDLAKSIKDNGQLQPVVVRPYSGSENGYKYSLVAGFQRMKAIGLLLETRTNMAVLVRVVDAEDTGAIIANVVENKDRYAGTIIDLSYAIGKLKDGVTEKDEAGTITVIQAGMAGKEIAEQLGLSQGNVSEIEKMRFLRQPIQKKIHNGEITKDLARQLIRMTEEEQDETLAQVEAGVSQHALTHVAEDKRATKKSKGKRKSKKGSVGDDGDGEGGNGGSVKRPLSAKAALIEITGLVEQVEGEEEATASRVAVREVCKQIKRFMEGKIGSKALFNQIMKQLEEYAK